MPVHQTRKPPSLLAVPDNFPNILQSTVSICNTSSPIPSQSPVSLNVNISFSPRKTPRSPRHRPSDLNYPPTDRINNPVKRRKHPVPHREDPPVEPNLLLVRSSISGRSNSAEGRREREETTGLHHLRLLFKFRR
ncbi:uncharacterized protein CTRU02_207099 [Colletotrichum truncatum]|uniref:Uncharacterized protein n=1 Tax=Colletotrichum truncatum TaxID=5467 RepID=A0ACC3YZW0_COLTU